MSLTPFRLALLFALYASVMACTVVWKLPAFMAPDEMNHLRRAALLSHGQLIGHRVHLPNEVVAGGPVDQVLNRTAEFHLDLPYKLSAHFDETKKQAAWSQQWTEEVKEEGWQNTSVYPPVFYLPSGLAILLGKSTHLSVMSTILLARTANALVSILVAASAIFFSRRAAPYLFTILLLPMSTFLYGSVTQDGLLIATAAVAGALIARAKFEEREMTQAEWVGCIVALVLVGTAKPPYTLLAFAFLLAPLPKRQALIGFLCTLGICLLWHAWIAAIVQTPLKRDDVVLNAGGQAHYLATHLWMVVPIALLTIKHSTMGYALQFIGLLGWLDVPLPKQYYVVAAVLLVVAFWTLRPGKWTKTHSLGTALWVVTLFSVFLGLYVAYSPVGWQEVDGVQGRYFLPIAAFLPALYATGKEQSRSLPVWVLRLLYLFPIISAVVLYRTLGHRYW